MVDVLGSVDQTKHSSGCSCVAPTQKEVPSFPAAAVLKHPLSPLPESLETDPMFVLHKPRIATLVSNRTQRATDLLPWKTVSSHNYSFRGNEVK